MADPDPRRTIFEAMPPAAPEALEDPAPDWLLTMLHDAGLSVCEDASVVADRLTAQSLSFMQDAPTGRNGDLRSLHDGSVAARLAPAARNMLGWVEPEPDPDDRFAARLIAAFQSGALDVRPGGALREPAPEAARNSATPADAPKRYAARGQAFPRPELKHQKYPASGVFGRSIYAPW